MKTANYFFTAGLIAMAASALYSCGQKKQESATRQQEVPETGADSTVVDLKDYGG